ncbi:MAG: hypothetical protein WCR21_12465 [Bacteroidota bacterium]
MRFFCLFFLAQCALAQSVNTGADEKIWALTHPLAAAQVKKIYKSALPIYKQTAKDSILDKYASGGSLDAYRHCFMMAAFAQKINLKKIRRLGELHEKSNYRNFQNSINENGELPDSLSTVMDLYNNEIGFAIGKKNVSLSLQALSDMVIKQINQGLALKMKRNKKGEYLDCEGHLIQLKKYPHTWNIPKCLVPTDQD